MSDKPTTAELITMLSEFNCHADVQELAADRLEALEAHITALEAEIAELREQVVSLDREYKWQHGNRGAAEANIKELKAEKAALEKTSQEGWKRFKELRREIGQSRHPNMDDAVETNNKLLSKQGPE